MLDRSHLHPYTPHTTWNRDELNAKLKQAAAKGYATAFEEYFHGDLSFASPILDARHQCVRGGSGQRAPSCRSRTGAD
ncbi:IclR family transcriptional regulator domain-containing protein [Bacillus paralicheniformis]|uniref:IclR family transcriptional regulator domain-containing protein n=1 Tax=Bacillus paralicheniformis TaxID=1648923 RepID=UPI003BF9CBD0